MEKILTGSVILFLVGALFDSGSMRTPRPLTTRGGFLSLPVSGALQVR
jgi:hypothetical protein